MMQKKKKIYLDYAATTPVDRDVVKKIIPLLNKNFGNPSSLHFFGQEALSYVDSAREKVASFLGSKEREIVFTSSATVANNIFISGILKKEKGLHAITSAFEHKAVLEPLKRSGAEVTHLPVYKEGVVKVKDVKKAIKENTALVSIGYVNSEVGTIQPIKDIGEMIVKENKKRKKKIIFHTDAVQAVNYLPCKVEELRTDALTLSGHKIYGPKGAAVLFIREGVDVSPILFGASQEKRIHPGTENVFAIAGLGFALETISKNDIKKIKKMQDKVIDFLLSDIPQAQLNGDRKRRIPGNINITFPGVEGESLMMALDNEGVAVSTGSACASKSLAPSYVLLSLGVSHEEAHGSLRISLGRFTTKEDVDYFLVKLPGLVKKLRKISGR